VEARGLGPELGKEGSSAQLAGEKKKEREFTERIKKGGGRGDRLLEESCK